MKLFQIAQENLLCLGISSNQSKKYRQLSLTCSIYSLFMLLSAAFLTFEANTFKEYTNSVYTTSSLIAINILFTIIYIKREKLFKLFDDGEHFFDESEFIQICWTLLIHPVITDDFKKIFRNWKFDVDKTPCRYSFSGGNVFRNIKLGIINSDTRVHHISESHFLLLQLLFY